MIPKPTTEPEKQPDQKTDLEGVASTDLLASWVTPDAIEAVKLDFDETVPAEVLVIAAALWSLGASTLAHAKDEQADGFLADKTEDRANRYADSYWALADMWS